MGWAESAETRFPRSRIFPSRGPELPLVAQHQATPFPLYTQAQTMGDDLEDDFVPGGDEYLSSGEDEDDTTGLGGDPDVDGEGIVPDSRSDSPLVAGGKRKASDDEDGSDSEEDDTVKNGPKTGAGGKELTAEERKKEKKRRNKEKLKEKKVRSAHPPLAALSCWSCWDYWERH